MRAGGAVAVLRPANGIGGGDRRRSPAPSIGGPRRAG
jgi:hypothetical protein